MNTGAADKVASSLTPESEKSFTQSVGDSAQKGHDDAKSATAEHQASLAETASAYVEVAKEQVANAAQYVSSVVTGAGEGAQTGHDVGKK